MTERIVNEIERDLLTERIVKEIKRNLVTERIVNEIKRDLAHVQRWDLLDMMIHGLAEEAGEISGLRKRQLKGIGVPAERYLDELGDLWWYLVGTIHTVGFTLEQVDEYNKKKLEARYGGNNNDGETVRSNSD